MGVLDGGDDCQKRRGTVLLGVNVGVPL